MCEFLTITLEKQEMWDDANECFYEFPEETVTFYYTLKNLDKWEMKYRKRFIDNEANISREELLDFITMMADKDIDMNRLTENDFIKIKDYFSYTPTATVIQKSSSPTKGYHRKKIFTSEIIYAMMALNHVPFDWENRNLNKLIMLLNCVGSLQEPPKKMTRAEAMAEHHDQVIRNRKIMEERRRQMNG